MNNPMYDEFAREYDSAIQNNSYNAHYERPSLLSLLPEVNEKTVIDLGCGPGLYSKFLVENGAKVTAVDGSQEMIQIVKEKLGDKIQCYVQNLADGLPNEQDQTFDVAVCPLMIHYLEDFTKLFSDIKRILKSDGIFIFSTHHPFVDYQLSPSGNYFLTEKIVDEWDTVGRPVRVEYYRRPLTSIIQAIVDAGMCVITLTEGEPDSHMQESSPESYQKLSTEPGFLFLKCKVVS
ncbi:class I SAM-dependent DNA methyltransferase [Gimesia aquarii]|uniref:Malonyl-[acyl-carrier protein] O-methyltransferase n=1 Tax=Gimesia aquarii TaxID=2527964 RepID=A0A517VYY3_9PLAN|nr:class I SAM-dependent methyltransferase [Gimesia aquarii]QDT98212.1 Malonyl-[acyl-carrier protein] O-methyltransferase [Gimesia aquarii]